jgi:hypothetical protein
VEIYIILYNKRSYSIEHKEHKCIKIFIAVRRAEGDALRLRPSPEGDERRAMLFAHRALNFATVFPAYATAITSGKRTPIQTVRAGVVVVSA